MPIYHLHPKSVQARCAYCGVDRRIDHAQIRREGDITPVLALPACECGAVEYLVPTTAPTSASGADFPSLHRLLVGHLRVLLEQPANTIAAATPTKVQVPDELVAYFPDELRISVSMLPPPVAPRRSP